MRTTSQAATLLMSRKNPATQYRLETANATAPTALGRAAAAFTRGAARRPTANAATINAPIATAACANRAGEAVKCSAWI